MLKLVYSMAELDIEQLLKVYEGQNLKANDFVLYLCTDFFQQ